MGQHCGPRPPDCPDLPPTDSCFALCKRLLHFTCPLPRSATGWSHSHELGHSRGESAARSRHFSIASPGGFSDESHPPSRRSGCRRADGCLLGHHQRHPGRHSGRDCFRTTTSGRRACRHSSTSARGRRRRSSATPGSRIRRSRRTNTCTSTAASIIEPIPTVVSPRPTSTGISTGINRAGNAERDLPGDRGRARSAQRHPSRSSEQRPSTPGRAIPSEVCRRPVGRHHVIYPTGSIKKTLATLRVRIFHRLRRSCSNGRNRKGNRYENHAVGLCRAGEHRRRRTTPAQNCGMSCQNVPRPL